MCFECAALTVTNEQCVSAKNQSTQSLALVHTLYYAHTKHNTQYAKDALHPSHHGVLATFLASGGGDGDKFKGAHAALALPGLTLMQEAVLRVQLRHWPMVSGAVVCCVVCV